MKGKNWQKFVQSLDFDAKNPKQYFPSVKSPSWIRTVWTEKRVLGDPCAADRFRALGTENNPPIDFCF